MFSGQSSLNTVAWHVIESIWEGMKARRRPCPDSGYPRTEPGISFTRLGSIAMFQQAIRTSTSYNRMQVFVPGDKRSCPRAIWETNVPEVNGLSPWSLLSPPRHRLPCPHSGPEALTALPLSQPLPILLATFHSCDLMELGACGRGPSSHDRRGGTPQRASSEAHPSDSLLTDPLTPAPQPSTLKILPPSRVAPSAGDSVSLEGLFIILRQGQFHISGWVGTSCFCLSNAGIVGMSHHS